MKKFISILLVCLMCVPFFASCNSGRDAADNGTSTALTTADDTSTVNDETASDSTDNGEFVIPDGYEAAEMRVYAMNGPTGMGMAKLISDSKADKTVNDYDFVLVSSADQIKAEIIKGEYEVAAIPTNLASVLYNKTGGEFFVAAVNTLGVLYIIENGDSVKSINDLNGKTIAATGQGSVPEYVLNYIIDKADIDVEVVYYTDGSELAGKVASGDIDIAMLPVPYATTVTMGDSNARIALSVTEEFKKASGTNEDSLCQACIVIRREFADNNPDAVKVFLKEYGDSVNFVLANHDEAAGMMEEAGIIPKKAVALKAIPNANLVFLTGEKMKNALSTFYGVLFNANPASVGGKLPDEKIYG